MADRRMISRSVVTTDQFLDLEPAQQALYFQLLLAADDDGFIAAPKATQRASGASVTDLTALLNAGYLLDFDSGVVVIRHWKQHNCVQKDRYKKTAFQAELATLAVDENGIYVRIQTVSKVDTQVSIYNNYNNYNNINNYNTNLSSPDLSTDTNVVEVTDNDELLEAANELAAKNGHAGNEAYVRGILRNWAKAGIRSRSEARKTFQAGTSQYRNPALNYQQRTHTDADFEKLFIDL